MWFENVIQIQFLCNTDYVDNKIRWTDISSVLIIIGQLDEQTELKKH